MTKDKKNSFEYSYLSSTLQDYIKYAKLEINLDLKNCNSIAEYLENLNDDTKFGTLITKSLQAGFIAQQPGLDDEELGYDKLADATLQAYFEALGKLDVQMEEIKNTTPKSIREKILKDEVVSSQLFEHFLYKFAINIGQEHIAKNTFKAIESYRSTLDYSVGLLLSQSMAAAYSFGQKMQVMCNSKD
jgi:hypothetical protein